MAEASFETLFESCVLEVTAPDTSVIFPEDISADEWLGSLEEPAVEREQAFFDEQLRLLVTMKTDYRSSNGAVDAPGFPQHLIDFLSHIQLSLEATYISQKLDNKPETPRTDVLAPPRTSSAGVPKGRPTSLHPSIFPPSTPNPIPSTTERDRKYVQSEGVLLLSSIWGANASGQHNERFTLLFSEAQGVWIAIYEFSLVVSFLRLPFTDPLLCLTVSATLRDKAVSPSQVNNPFVLFLSARGMILHRDLDTTPERGVGEEDEGGDMTGFEEVNLLEGLSLGSDASDSERLHMPSTRLGNVTRRQLFCLPPISSLQDESSAPAWKRPHHILRKSCRKVLQTVSGFHVRMRTVFVPHVLLPKDVTVDGDGVSSYIDGMNEEWEAGNNEQTVVLCVEVENSGESGPEVGFALERVGVKVGGDGATTRLIGWGDNAFAPDIEQRLFPLLIGSMEQFNLLYIVSFLDASNEKDIVSLMGPARYDNKDLLRPVTITIHGRPYFTSTKLEDNNDTLSYPTGTFSSIWNCMLDLSPKRREEPPDFHEPLGIGAPRSALPEPASPLPGHNTFPSFLASPSTPRPTPQVIAGKRHTLPANIAAMRAINSFSNARFSMPPRDQGTSSPIPPSQIVFSPQSASMQASSRPPSTTLGVPPATPGVGSGFNQNTRESEAQSYVSPPTPAYPSFSPSAVAHTPYTQALGSQQYLGPSVEIRRERGAGMMSATPQTPLPIVHGAKLDPQSGSSQTSGEPVIVSVGLLPAKQDDADEGFERRKIYPSDIFTLDIFVYNRSSWTRRFEVSCPDVDRRRQRKFEQNQPLGPKSSKAALEELKAAIEPPGILPMENRVRVGPLRPSTCQSVRIDFIALSSGVHSVDVLTLTDIETGYSVNLRSVIDIVVHERDGGNHARRP